MSKVAVAGVEPDFNLREKLENYSKEALFDRLQRLDSEKASQIDRNSPHRLIRAIEIAEAPRKTSCQSGYLDLLTLESPPLWIGLNCDRELLYQRIDKRVDEMMAEGLLSEVETLVSDYGWDAPALNSIGYIEFKPYFKNDQTLEECVARVKFNTHAYARRQLTWFRRNKDIEWFDVEGDGVEERIARVVKDYLQSG